MPGGTGVVTVVVNALLVGITSTLPGLAILPAAPSHSWGPAASSARVRYHRSTRGTARLRSQYARTRSASAFRPARPRADGSSPVELAPNDEVLRIPESAT